MLCDYLLEIQDNLNNKHGTRIIKYIHEKYEILRNKKYIQSYLNKFPENKIINRRAIDVNSYAHIHTNILFYIFIYKKNPLDQDFSHPACCLAGLV